MKDNAMGKKVRGGGKSKSPSQRQSARALGGRFKVRNQEAKGKKR